MRVFTEREVQISFYDFHTLKQMVRESTLIVIAELTREQSRRSQTLNGFGKPTRDIGQSLYRTFAVREVLKGEAPTAEIEVGYAQRLEFHSSTNKYAVVFEVPPAQVGSVYVVFLRHGVDPRGKERIVIAGHPSTALIIGEHVEFQVTSRFRDSLLDIEDQHQRRQRSAPPNLLAPLTLTEIRKAVQ